MSIPNQLELFDDELRTTIQFTASMEVTPDELAFWEGDPEAFLKETLGNLQITLIGIEDA